MPLKTRSDLVEAIINNSTTGQEDDIIKLLDELATVEYEEVTSTVHSCSETENEVFYDSTSEMYYFIDSEITYFCDSTSVILTNTTIETIETVTEATPAEILTWRESYYEDVFNQSIRAKGGIVIKDNNGPYYPLTDYTPLIDSLFDNGGVYFATNDYVEYEYPNINHVDKLSVWTDSTGVISCYLSYSNNGVDWIFLGLDVNENIESKNNESDAINNPILSNDTGYIEVDFSIGIHAKYIRLHTLNDITIYELLYSTSVKDHIVKLKNITRPKIERNATGETTILHSNVNFESEDIWGSWQLISSYNFDVPYDPNEIPEWYSVTMTPLSSASFTDPWSNSALYASTRMEVYINDSTSAESIYHPVYKSLGWGINYLFSAGIANIIPPITAVLYKSEFLPGDNLKFIYLFMKERWGTGSADLVFDQDVGVLQLKIEKIF